MDNQEASKLLRNVDENRKFFLVNGKTARNQRELLRCILALKATEFKHHVYANHNDFSNWLKDVVGDDVLAKDIFAVTSKDKSVALMRARVHYLEEQAGD